jgi:hypothetical protein
LNAQVKKILSAKSMALTLVGALIIFVLVELMMIWSITYFFLVDISAVDPSQFIFESDIVLFIIIIGSIIVSFLGRLLSILLREVLGVFRLFDLLVFISLISLIVIQPASVSLLNMQILLVVGAVIQTIYVGFWLLVFIALFIKTTRVQTTAISYASPPPF